MTIHPNQFFKILIHSSPESSPLDSEVVELCGLSDDQYRVIYQALSSFDQCIVDDKINKTKEYVRTLTDFCLIGVKKDPEVLRLRDLAVKNLLVVREYQYLVQIAKEFPKYDIHTLLAGVQNRPLYCRALYQVLKLTPADGYQILLQILEAEKEFVLIRLMPFLRNDLPFEGLLRLANTIKMCKNHPEVLEMSLPLLRLCTDSAHFAELVYAVAQAPSPFGYHAIQLILDRNEPMPSRSVAWLFRNLVDRSVNHVLNQTFEQMHIHEPEHDFYIDRSDFSLHPETVLRHFVAFIREKKPSSFKVKFIKENAVDIGGPGKEFFFNLIKAIAEKWFVLCSNGLYKPGRLVTKELAEVCSNLGHVFMFCLHSDDYRIGMQFDRSLFFALFALNSRYVEAMDEVDSDTAAFDLLFDLYEQMFSHSEDDVLSIKRMKKGVYGDSEYTESALEVARENIKLALSPCIEVWKAMRSSGCSMPAMESVDELDAHIQGTVTAEELFTKIAFDKSVSHQKKGWIKRWVTGMDRVKMKKFLYYVTGTAGLGNTPVKIAIEGNVLQASTCFLMLIMPDYASEDEMVAQLEEALNNEVSFSAR